MRRTTAISVLRVLVYNIIQYYLALFFGVRLSARHAKKTTFRVKKHIEKSCVDSAENVFLSSGTSFVSNRAASYAGRTASAGAGVVTAASSRCSAVTWDLTSRANSLVRF